MEAQKKKGKLVPIQKKNKFKQILDHLNHKYQFRRNIISLDIEVKLKDKDAWEELNESDLHYELYEANYTGFDGILKAILCSSNIPKFNPLKSYLENLPHWDQETDYINHLANFVKVEGSQSNFNIQFKKMLVRNIANSLGVIPFNKQCFTFIGKQNDGKTSFMRFLCPTPLKSYYRENIDIYNKDGKVALANNIIINLDEIATISYKDRNKIKSYMTTESIKERLPYDRTTTKINSIANFMASTNEDDFLTDDTGNTRWLIFKVKSILHDNGGSKGYNKNVNIDNVYSQAFHLLNNGFKYMMTSKEVKDMDKINKDYIKSFMELEYIRDNYKATDNKKPGNFYSASDLVKAFDEVHSTKAKINLIGKAMNILDIPKGSLYIKDLMQARKGYFLEMIDTKGFEIK